MGEFWSWRLMQCQKYREFGQVCENATDCVPDLNLACQTYSGECHCPQSQTNELCLCPPPRNETVTYCDCENGTRFIAGRGCRKKFVPSLFR